MAKFYTQTGDDGYTGLLGEGRTPKHDLRIECIGTIDEANAAIGYARSICKHTLTKETLLATQRDLYSIMAEIAMISQRPMRFSTLQQERVNWIEYKIEEIGKIVSIPNEFIVPGDSQAGAAIDIARATVRRAERKISKLLHQKELMNKEILRYINRLSSLCFALELLENKAHGNESPTLAKSST